MDNKIKFRNHISIVIEELGAIFWFVLIFLLGTIKDYFEDINNNIDSITLAGKKYWFVFPLLLVMLLITIIWKINKWRKTYIFIDSNVLVVERNTLNNKKISIAIKNISNVNTVQNLFESVIGTSALKLDTNTFSTADSTDVKIILKKEQAEQLKNRLLELINGSSEIKNIEEDIDKIDNDICIKAESKDLIKHGVFSINVFSVLAFIAYLIGIIVYIVSLCEQNYDGITTKNIIINSILLIITGFTILWNTAKDFIKFWNYRVYRAKDNINLSYGIIKKVNYTIPISTINAVKLKQTFIARLFKRYMVEIVNVGLGDDETENNSFLLLYGTKNEIKEKLNILLPEFNACIDKEINKCPKCSWIIWSIPISIFIAIITSGVILAMELINKSHIIILAIGSIICIIGFVVLLGYYFTAGIAVTDSHLVLSKGYFKRELIFIQYNKIQYIKVKQNFIANHFGMYKGEVYILANLLNNIHGFPYCPEHYVKSIKEKILSHNTIE